MPAAQILASAALITALAAAAPSAAGAASLQPLKPCYRSLGPGVEQREPLVVAGQGFTPDAVLELRVDGRLATTVQADGTGALPPEELRAPFRARGERSFEVTVVEQGNPANTATARARVTALTARLSPATARPSQRVSWRGRGFTAQRAVFAHYVFNGRSVRTVRVAQPRGLCGRFAVRRRQFPFRPRTGEWILQLDQHRHYRPAPQTTYVRLRLVVSRS